VGSFRPGSNPLQSFSPPPDRPTSRSDPTSLRSPAPSNGILVPAPSGAGRPFPLRFRSQAFSTSQRFPSKLEFHGLVSCRNRSWVTSPSELSPRRDRVPLSRPLAPPQLSTAVPGRTPARPFAARFPDSHARGAVAWFPRRLWVPFPRVARTRFPVALSRTGIDRFRQLHLPRSFAPPANPFASSRRTGNGGRCSPGLVPS
jgi:hypothetical protein